MNKVFSRRWRLALAFICGYALLSLLSWGLREVNRKDTPQRFEQLCSLLLPPLHADKEAVVQPTEEELKVDLQTRQENLTRLADECRQLAPIAEESNRAIGAALELSKNAKQPGTLLLSGIETAVGLYLKSSSMAESGSKDALKELKDYVKFWDEVKSIHQNLEVQKLKLLQAAPQFSGSNTNISVLSAQMTEGAPNPLWRLAGEKHTIAATQTLTMTNASGMDLSCCVVSVRLVEADGKSYLHIYYVSKWQKGETRIVKYSPNEVLPETSADVNRVQIQLFAKELTSQVSELTRKDEAWPYADEQK